MKKVCVLFALLSFLLQPSFAAVLQSSSSVNIESEVLKDKYSAYEIKFTNTGQNPVKISNIDVKNIVNNANQTILSSTTTDLKNLNKYLYMSIVTMCISLFVYNSKSSTILNNQKIALAEAATFNASLVSSKNEIIMPDKTKLFKILIPISQTPIVEGVFQDTETGRFIESSDNNL